MQLRNRFSEISGLLFETENTPTHFFFSSASPSIHFLSLLENYSPARRPVFATWKLFKRPSLVARGFLRLPTQPFSPDLRRNEEAISRIHSGMILQNLTLVCISVHLRVLFVL